MSANMHQKYFFGYGSLVNRATHAYGQARPARLFGWRRIWRHTDLRPVAYLTAIPDPDCAIDGLIAHVPGDDWRALDIREHAYDRVAVCDDVTHDAPDPIHIAVYTVPEGKHGRPSAEHPVLLSYIDTVVQGYLQEFGASGVAHFFATTSGWSAPILDDRSAPIYPRAQTTTDALRKRVDTHLAHLATTRIPLAEAHPSLRR
ncbi:gamma-glutamylcyclotransferase family protein [Shimia aestuarii]|uniref:gamma-glutamylcyclotransferase family protein n=1 Tax=Shimia aestuarii TaxID=254406 RepID=UPI001FB265A8|nr:gamma-glutamylcyclotransferase family protein [Shimia aestuarii]